MQQKNYRAMQYQLARGGDKEVSKDFPKTLTNQTKKAVNEYALKATA